AGIRSIALAVRDSGQEERYLAALGESGDEWPARIIPKGGGPGFQTSGGGLRNSSGQLPSGSGTGNPEACISFAQDSYPDSGPLAGLHASLSGVPEEGYVFVMACDMPVLSIPLFRRLAELAVHTGEPGPDIIRTSGQPFHALYHTRT
ncbi:NTP transferase domain-containing protein, partial [Paenibacillus sepulcri]|nr:NTP transferase domain-containing protein [Paenibacillus sepulcri]